jgi:hypothetical protein
LHWHNCDSLYLSNGNANIHPTKKIMADATRERVIAKTAQSGKLTDLTNAPNAIYRGQQAHFCTVACLRTFEQKSDPFITSEIEHPIDDVE